MPQDVNPSHPSAYVIHDHLVWIPRDRKKGLVGPVEARLKERLAEIATQDYFEIMAVEVMPEHVQLFVRAPPKFAPAENVRLFKGITSRKRKPLSGKSRKAKRNSFIQSLFFKTLSSLNKQKITKNFA